MALREREAAVTGSGLFESELEDSEVGENSQSPDDSSDQEQPSHSDEHSDDEEDSPDRKAASLSLSSSSSDDESTSRPTGNINKKIPESREVHEKDDNENQASPRAPLEPVVCCMIYLGQDEGAFQFSRLQLGQSRVMRLCRSRRNCGPTSECIIPGLSLYYVLGVHELIPLHQRLKDRPNPPWYPQHGCK